MPLTVDGTIDPAVAKKWIKDSVQVQAGRRGVGARAARRQNPDNGSAEPKEDGIAQHTRLTRLRADKLEMENARLKGGTEDERQLALAEGTALRCWWCFQRATPAAIAAALAYLVDRRHDTDLMHWLTEMIRDRDQQIMSKAYEEICRGFGGLIPPVRDPSPGTPWRPTTPLRPRTRTETWLVDGEPYPPRKPEADDA
jgi:hypothetical protein